MCADSTGMQKSPYLVQYWDWRFYRIMYLEAMKIHFKNFNLFRQKLISQEYNNLIMLSYEWVNLSINWIGNFYVSNKCIPDRRQNGFFSSVWQTWEQENGNIFLTLPTIKKIYYYVFGSLNDNCIPFCSCNKKFRFRFNLR